MSEYMYLDELVYTCLSLRMKYVLDMYVFLMNLNREGNILSVYLCCVCLECKCECTYMISKVSIKCIYICMYILIIDDNV